MISRIKIRRNFVMKFKKAIAAITSAALSLSMLAAVNVSANTPGAIDSEDGTYSLGFEVKNDGAYISWVYATDYSSINEIVIPEKTEAGIPVVGIEDTTFYHCYDLQTVVIPDSVKAENIGPVAFLRADDVSEFLLSNGQDMNLTTGLTYAANIVEFMGKDDWEGDEEELEAAKNVLKGIKATAGFDDPDTDEDDEMISLDDAAEIVRYVYVADEEGCKDEYVREEAVVDTTKMSEKSYDNFKAWVNIIPENLTIKANEDSDAAKNAKAKEILCIKFEANETHLIGDANQDGVVNVRDCAKIANALAFKTVDELPCKICADYNQDNEITVRDAAQLANYLATNRTLATLSE